MQPETGPRWQLPLPRWQGEPLAGRRIYFWAEQGLGDTVMFASLLPQVLAQKPARVALGMFPKLIPLFARSFPGIAVEPIAEAGKHALAQTLLAAFPSMEKVPEPLRQEYARVAREGVFEFAAPISALADYALPQYVPARHGPFLKAAAGKRPGGCAVGISWQTSNPEGTLRNIPLTEWLPVLECRGCRFFSLQHHVAAEDVRAFCAAHSVQIEMPGFDPVQDIDALAALIAGMDEVITADNANAHLAGALGVPTTLLLPDTENFRWPVRHAPDTLWYQSIKVLRQEVLGEWAPVILSAAKDLRRAAQDPSLRSG